MVFLLFLTWTFVIFARPQDFFPFIGVFRPALLLTASILALTIASGNFKFAEIFSKYKQVKRYYLLYLLMIIGLPFAMHLGNSLSFIIFNYLINILYFTFFIIYVDSVEKLKKVLFIVILAALFYASMSLLSSGTLVGRFRFGNMYDPNDLACFLISLFPLSFYFLSRHETGIKKLVAMMTVVIALGVAFLTGSRGGVVGLGAVGFVLFVSSVSPLKMGQRFLLLIAFIIALIANLDNIDTERFSSLLNPEEDYNVKNEQGRISVWKKGWQISLRHPFTGVGVNNFPIAIGTYRDQIGEIPRWQAAHNPYIQIVTELGFPGIILFLALIGSSLLTFYRSSKSDEEASEEELQQMDMNRAILVAFVGNLVTSFFLSMAYSMLLTLFLSLSVAVKQIQEPEEEEAATQ